MPDASDALAWNSGLVVLVPTNYLSELYLQAQLAEIVLFIFWHVVYGFELESLCPLFPLLSVADSDLCIVGYQVVGSFGFMA